MEGCMIFNPKSLYNICLYFVSKNVGYIESLESFPSSIGEEIFQSCLAVGSLNENNEDTVHALQKFAEAYSSDFKNSFKCNSIIFVSNFEECLYPLLFPISQLDLSNCELGNCSLLLTYLHKMSNLSVLNLSNNRLSDKGFRNIFLPFKVYKKGFGSLLALDLTSNEVTLHSLKSIMQLPKLKKLCLTIPQISDEYVKGLTQTLKSNKFIIDVINDRREFLCIENDGWGSSLISRWENNVTDLQNKRRKMDENPKNAKQFYRNIFKADKLNCKLAQTSVTHNTQTAFTYVKVEDNLTLNMSHSTNKENTSQGNNKRSLDSGSSLEESNTAKRKSYADGKAELFDLELLKMYMKN